MNFTMSYQTLTNFSRQVDPIHKEDWCITIFWPTPIIEALPIKGVYIKNMKSGKIKIILIA